MCKIGFLKKDRQEKFNTKRSWWVVAWRIVDADDHDIIQPWMKTKTEARRICKDLHINLIESKPQ